MVTYQIVRIDAAGAEHLREQRQAENAQQATLAGLLAWIVETGGTRQIDYIVARPT